VHSIDQNKVTVKTFIVFLFLILFLKDHMTEDMMLKIQLCHHMNKLHFKIYKNRKMLL